MAEVKNSFIKSKMNKDLDARLLPNGEYREGLNIQVSRSEGADVGALENVLGNEDIIDFKTISGCNPITGGDCNLKTIGMFTDEVNNNIYIFLTDYTDSGFETLITYNNASHNYIYIYNILNEEANLLVTGSFLNFSTTNPIYSINILEGILFWTDNRNQPRKIDVNRASTNSTEQLSNNYYTTEEQISVATYNPYQTIDLYFNKWGGGTVKTTVTAGTTISFVADSLTGIPAVGSSVAKADNTVIGTIVSFDFNASSIVISTATTLVIGDILRFFVANNFAASTATYYSSMYDATSKFAPDGTTPNPTFQTAGPNAIGETVTNYPGDPDFLEDKFVRFSYRFKFDGGENSIFAPFTQPAFIPKQDGYFLESTTPTGNTKDENSTYRSTIVAFMENQVNNILLQIPLPCPANELYDKFKIIEIEVLYKESDGLAVQLLDTIARDGIGGFEKLGGTDNIVVYNYQGAKPYRTLPTADLIRVFDKVPVRAHGQEIIGNRVVYSNFQTQHTPPESLNYNVGIYDKNTFSLANTDNLAIPSSSIVEYPMHTVKQNRNYQVGVVLSDKFGRQSTVLLSSAVVQNFEAGGININAFGGSTVYFPYRKDKGTGKNDMDSWPGDSIKVLFNQAIGTTGIYAGNNSNFTNGWPGIYNGDTTKAGYNPLGWYSYKIVIKQQEQEYYNVYLPGILNGYPNNPATPPDPQNTVAFITLLGDNINKVPRDLTDVGPVQVQFRSSVPLFGRVTPQQTAPGTVPIFNTQFYPTIEPDVVNTIGAEDNILGTTVQYDDIYQTESNPNMGRVSQSTPTNAIGSGPLAAGTYNFLLGVYETAPVDSRLNIFWETSTSGLISDLNLAIETGGSPAIKGFTTGAGLDTTWTYSQNESMPLGTVVAAAFYPYQQSLINGPLTVVKNSRIDNWWVEDGLGGTRTSDFTLTTQVNGDTSTYSISTNNTFYYGNDASTRESYKFFFEVFDDTNPGPPNTVQVNGLLDNSVPVITNCPISINPGAGDIVLFTYQGNNGSVDTAGRVLDLTWSIESQSSINPDNPTLTIVPISDANGEARAELRDETASLNGSVNVTIKLEDATGSPQSKSITCTTGADGSQAYPTVPTNINWFSGNFKTINEGPESSGFYWSSVIGNEVISTPLPGNASIGFTRAPISGLPEPSNPIGLSGISTATKAANGSCGASSGSSMSGDWNFQNTNRNALSFNAGYTNPAGLSTGTAFIMVDFEFTLPSTIAPQSDKPALIYPTYLQYRNPNGAGYPNNWTDAIDVEGKTIKFGGTSINNYEIYGNGIREDFTNTGVTDKSTSATALTDNTYLNTDAMEIETTGRANSGDTALSVQARRIFAFGKDQAYTTRPDYFGDYRLVVRYPYGDNIPNSLSADKIIPVLTSSSCPGNISEVTPYRIYNFAQQSQKVKLTYGDFFNPLMDGIGPPSAFGYLISSEGNTVKENAKSLSPIETVYAREWAFRYVTQFYTNPEMSIKYTNTTANSYYSYCSQNDNDLNGKYGNENSNTSNSVTSTDTRPPIGSVSDENRRWVAQFNGDGQKIAATSEPIMYAQGSTNTPLPPTGAVKLNTYGTGPFPSVVNYVSDNKVVIVWTQNQQAEFANIVTKNLTNNRGGSSGPVPFVGSFLKFYDPNAGSGYAQVAAVVINNSGTSLVGYGSGGGGQQLVTITNAQLLLTNGGTGPLVSGNYYYDWT